MAGSLIYVVDSQTRDNGYGVARVGQRDGGTGGVGSTYRGAFESTRELTCVGSGLVMLVVM
jgi:hypothetical protein